MAEDPALAFDGRDWQRQNHNNTVACFWLFTGTRQSPIAHVLLSPFHLSKPPSTPPGQCLTSCLQFPLFFANNSDDDLLRAFSSQYSTDCWWQSGSSALGQWAGGSQLTQVTWVLSLLQMNKSMKGS